MYYIPSGKDIEKENMNITHHPKSYIFRYSCQPTFYSLALTCRWMASLALPFLYMNPFIFDSSSFISTIQSRQTRLPQNPEHLKKYIENSTYKKNTNFKGNTKKIILNKKK